MKRAIRILFLLLLCCFLAGCTKTYYGTEELIEKARDELPIADADTIELSYAGQCIKEDMALLWFISGDAYQAHYYLPLSFHIVGNDAYTFHHTYKPMDRAMDIAVLHWNGGCSFLINNPECATVRITDNAGTHEIPIEKGTCPYVFYRDLTPSEYVFLDRNGNEIP